MKVFCILPEVSNKYPRCSVSVTWIQRWNSELLRPNPKRLCFVHETDYAKSSHHPPPSPNNAINVLILLKIYRIGSLRICFFTSVYYLLPNIYNILDIPSTVLNIRYHHQITYSCRKKCYLLFSTDHVLKSVVARKLWNIQYVAARAWPGRYIILLWSSECFVKLLFSFIVSEYNYNMKTCDEPSEGNISLSH